MATVWLMITIIAFPAPSRCFKTTCEIPSVEAGDNATLTTHFEEDISKEPIIDFTVLHLSHDLKESNMLSCTFTYGNVTCDKTTCCTWASHVTDVFRVYIHNVSQELEGKFWGLVSPADGVNQKFCNFALKASTCYTSSIKTRNSRLICTEQSVIIGQTCIVMCSPDHYFQENQTSVRYMCVGKNKWSPDIPTLACEALTCSADSIHAANSHMNCSDLPLTIGQTCTLTCIYDHFYQVNQTSVVYTCVGKNKWAPEMAAISCEERQTEPKTHMINLLFLLFILIPAVIVFVVFFKKRQRNKKSKKTEEDESSSMMPDERSMLMDTTASLESHNDGVLLLPLTTSNEELQQSAQNLRFECILQWYPELQSQTYFVPPFHYNSASNEVETVAESLLVPQSKQDCVDKAVEQVLQCFRTLADNSQAKEVMMILSQLQFRKYLGESSYKADVALSPLQNTLPEQFLQLHHGHCNFDVVIIHMTHGLLTLQIKSMGENFNQLKMTEQEEDDVVMKEVNEAVKQLNKTEDVLKHITSDIQNSTYINKILVLPNISSSQLLQAINRFPSDGQGSSGCFPRTFGWVSGFGIGERQFRVKLCVILCECLGVKCVDDAVKLCLLSDQLSHRQTSSDINHSSLQSLREWWQNVVSASGSQSLMTSSLYKQLVARLCGLWTTVKFDRVSLMTMKTLGKEVSETGEKVSWIVLYPQQVDILNQSPPRVFISGPPGTGKTIVLILQGLTWLQRGYDVHVLSTRHKSLAAAIVIERQLQELLQMSAARSHVYQHQFNFEKDGEVESAVKHLKNVTEGRQLCVIADEAVRDNGKSFTNFCDQLIRTVPGVYIWGASVYHEVRPPFIEEVKLRTPLRSPPVVVKEVMESREIQSREVLDYTFSNVPVQADGPPVKRIEHREDQLGHTGKWPRGCVECGHEVARVLTELNVGQTVDNNDHPSLQYRDVLVLCVEHSTDDRVDSNGQTSTKATGLVRGLHNRKVPLRVVVKNDDIALRDMALGVYNMVTVASWDDVHGLERKVVVVESGNDWFYERLYAMSRCTLQLVVIKYEPVR